MKTDPHILSLLASLKLPAQDLPILAFCNSNKAETVHRWAESLPATRIAQTSALLYQALPEVTRLQISADTRLQMLEHLRPYVQQCIQGLTKNFLNQPLILPAGALKTAVVAQALQKHMSNGYILVAKEYLLSFDKTRKDSHEQLAFCLHRATTGLGLQLLRSYQLYTQAPAQLWQECHALYLLADATQLLKQKIAEVPLTIEQVYMRILLLSCANANQLSQADIGILYQALEQWSALTHLSDDDNHLFSVNLRSNIPPNYTKRFTESTSSIQKGLDLSLLLRELELLKDNNSRLISRPSLMSQSLFNHLLRIWTQVHERNNQRRPAQGTLEVLVGLSAIHYYLSGEQAFETFVYGRKQHNKDTKFQAVVLSSEYDPWAKVVDTEEISKAWTRKLEAEQAEQPAAPNPYTIYHAAQVDSSPGGYCLQWQDEIPLQIKAGELLALREPNRPTWAIAVVRWAKQHKGTSQMGVQLLAPQAEPYAAQILSKAGDNGEFMRALLLPEIAKIKQQASLLTSTRPFQAQQKINMRNRVGTAQAYLTDCIFSTNTISQFNFRQLETPTAVVAENSGIIIPPEDFSSSWE